MNFIKCLPQHTQIFLQPPGLSLANKGNLAKLPVVVGYRFKSLRDRCYLPKPLSHSFHRLLLLIF